MDFVTLALAAAVVKKVMDTARMAGSKDFKGVLTQVGAWLAGVLAVWTAAQAGQTVSGVNLAHVGMVVIIMLGIAVGSVGSTVHDGLAAWDTTGSSVDVKPGPDTTV